MSDNVIDLTKLIKPSPLKQTDPKTQDLKELGTAIDKLIISNVFKGVDLFEVCGILANRLGEAIRYLPDRELRTDILIEVLLKRSEK